VDFWDITKVMFRRWYVAVPLLLASIAGTGYTAVAVKPDYALTAYIQLIPPVASTEAEANTQRNPWLLLGLEALTQAADYATLDQTFLDDLQAKGESTNFSIEVGTPAGGATIEVVGATAAQAVQTTAAILQQFDQTVQSLQAQYNVKQADMITTHRLDRGENLKQRGGRVKRAVVVVGGVGLLLTAGLTIAFDAILRRRRRPKAAPMASPVPARAAMHYPPWYRNGSALPAPGSDDTAVLPAAIHAPPALGQRDLPAMPVATEHAVAREESAERKPAMDKLPVPSDVTIVLSMPRGPRAPGDNGGGKRP
jgi:hypothetical protein